jgi:filamentous hemagglutinin family protein
MGTAGPVPQQGRDYQITVDLGRQRGGNLFHSFSKFNVGTNESATFSGPNSVQNIISRVTGGQYSSIDGMLRSTIPGANLYLFNPAGVIFGANASLDLSGSFHVSSANYLRLADGVVFDAQPAPDPVLSSAPVAAFGFLSTAPQPVGLLGGKLEVPAGKTLAAVGGDVLLLQGSQMIAPAGRIDLVAAKASGEMVLTAKGPETGTIGSLGTVLVSGATVDVSGAQGGSVYIRAGQFTSQRSVVFADTYGSGSGQGIDIQVDRLELSDSTFITAQTLGSGRAGDIKVNARESVVIGHSTMGVDSFAPATGAAGTIHLSAPMVAVSGKSFISSTTNSTGAAGVVNLQVNQLLVSGGGQIDVGTNWWCQSAKQYRHRRSCTGGWSRRRNQYRCLQRGNQRQK